MDLKAAADQGGWREGKGSQERREDVERGPEFTVSCAQGLLDPGRGLQNQGPRETPHPGAAGHTAAHLPPLGTEQWLCFGKNKDAKGVG